MKTFKQFVFGNDKEKKLNESVVDDENENNEMKEEEKTSDDVETTNGEEAEEDGTEKITLKEKIAAINDSGVLSSSFGVLPKD